MVYLTRKEHFAASHRLYNPKFSDDENFKTYGKCAYPNGHGHNYEICVTVAGDPDRETGMIVDLKKLSDLIEAEILAKVDHRHLNFDVDFLKGVIPTAENLARASWTAPCPTTSTGNSHSATPSETPRKCAES